LFAGGVGRTDFPGGNEGKLLASLRERLAPLPTETVVVPGHGPETTIGIELVENPWMA
jgi:glyoxylase-like metal-dependent hydrolase (beta-lactamase superfamily II)